jgi:hypothetical protein
LIREAIAETNNIGEESNKSFANKSVRSKKGLPLKS